MSIPELLRRLWALSRRGRLESDLRREMQFHLEMLEDEGRDEGDGRAEIAVAARRQFGNELAIREAWPDVAGWASLDRLWQDVRHALNSLQRDRRFTAVAVLVLALGIGGNTTVFSQANALLLNPFPYPRADRLFEIKSGTREGEWLATVRVADFAYWREHATSFESIAAYGDMMAANLTAQSGPGFQGPERVMTGHATESFLRTLAIAPALGRFFNESEDRPSGPAVVVLSHGAWKRRYGASPDVLGETVTLEGSVRGIIGVMPPGLRLPGTTTCEFWIPAAYDVAANMRPGYDTR